MIEIFIVIKDGSHQYYLLKVQRRGFDVYCFPPHLGVHYSLHESGEAHFKFDCKVQKPKDELPIALMMGEAGTPLNRGIVRAPIRDLGRASGICTAIYSIDALSNEFREFNRSIGECFVIDTVLFPKNTKGVEVGVWAVPDRNKVSFEYNNPNITPDLLYKESQCEPQIWIYAQPF